MGEMNNISLDRHYTWQLRMMGDVYTHCLSQADYKIGARWLQIFAQATGADKYARNCLMLLMYSQLRERGKLGSPFTELGDDDGTQCRLEDVLSEFEKRTDHKQLQKADLLEKKPQELTVEQVPPLSIGDGSEGDTNSCSYGGGSSRRSLRHPEQAEPEQQSSVGQSSNSNYERISQRNLQLIEELGQLHARTVAHEQRMKQTDSNWQQRIKQSQAESPMPTQRAKALLIKIERGTHQAIRRLREWSADTEPLNFLTTCLQDVLAEEPESLPMLNELDCKLEHVLDRLLEQAGERREKNVRILYDQLLEQQHDSLQSKHEALQREQQALERGRQELQRQLHDLRHREHRLWQQQ
ncbi:hypothetical protein KR222_009640, partial [Zaprionus bogoriensis]